MRMIPLLLALAVGYAHPEQLVETDWVAAHAGDANVRVVDMRSAATAYPAGHVPGAVYLSPVAIRVADRPPTFLPTPQEFEALMAKLGIGDATRVALSMPSVAISASNSCGVGRNVGGRSATRIATGDR